ncbi:MAG: hypothetical protein QOG09_1115, partial [Solirubrobacterales bacterium]|nr:hypothetical protein [Solirubrobacterales bacterium]
GVAEQLDPDPACQSLVPLLHYVRGAGDLRKFAPVRLTTAARVPLENDSDPSNDNDFEVVAMGTQYQPSHAEHETMAMLVYRDGRWRVDERAMPSLYSPISSSSNPTSLAFTGPNDGWLTSTIGTLRHFDGSRWVLCDAAQGAACGDVPAAPRLPTGASLLDVSETADGPLRLATVGRRVYLYGSAHRGDGKDYPILLYKDPAGHWTGSEGDGSAYDPGCASRDASQACVALADADPGAISALTLKPDGNGDLRGWASGVLSHRPGNIPDVQVVANTKSAAQNHGLMLRLGPGGSGGARYAWQRWQARDATSDYPERLYFRPNQSFDDPPELITLPGGDGEDITLLAPVTHHNVSAGPMLWFNPVHRRWEVLPAPFRIAEATGDSQATARVRAIGSDSRGGAWLAVRRIGGEDSFRPRSVLSSISFYRYTTEAPKQVFEEVSNPAGQQEMVGAAGGGDGSFWLATNSPTVYRYNRVTGWDRMTVPNWDPGRVVTRVSPASAIAIGADGSGVLVGEAGRIADLKPGSVALDAAAGRSCGRGDPPPCGTGRNLTSAAVGPGDAAMVGGEARTVLWRPAGGQFRAVEKPPAALAATITGVALPAADRAWLCTDHGEVFSGVLQGTHWQWRLEDDTPDGVVLAGTLDGQSGEAGEPASLRAIAIDGDFHGYAVGDFGVILERSGNGEHPWRRVGGLPISRYRSVTVAPGGVGHGALIGGDYGLVLTESQGRWDVARAGDPYNGIDTSADDYRPNAPVGLAIVPGQHDGEVEAWAAEQGFHNAPGYNDSTPINSALLHYSSDPEDSLLDGREADGAPLADVPPERPHELRLGVFGKSECAQPLVNGISCPAPTGANLESDLIPRRIGSDLLDGRGPLDLGLFTGSAVEGASRDNGHAGQLTAPNASPQTAENLVSENTGGSDPVQQARNPVTGTDHTDPSLSHREWSTLVTSRFADAGTPFFAAMGTLDLSKIAKVSNLVN